MPAPTYTNITTVGKGVTCRSAPEVSSGTVVPLVGQIWPRSVWC